MTREGVTVLACSLLQIIAAGRNVAVCKSERIKRRDRSLLIAGEGWDGGQGGELGIGVFWSYHNKIYFTLL